MASKILAIDPGTKESAFLFLVDGQPEEFGFIANEKLEDICTLARDSILAIEWVSFYGREIHAGSETFETCYWVGRFAGAWERTTGDKVIRIPRREIRAELCGTMKAGDVEVRAVLIDRFGGKEQAIGKKKTPGPLHGVASHIWSALAVGMVQFDRMHGKR